MSNKQNLLVGIGALVLVVFVGFLLSRPVNVNVSGVDKQPIVVNYGDLSGAQPSSSVFGATFNRTVQPESRCDWDFSSSATTATTTLCYVQNTDVTNRYLTGSYTYFGDTSGGYRYAGASVSLEATTSTNQYTTSTNAMELLSTTWSTSTLFQVFASSTFTNPLSRVWAPNEYIVVKSGNYASGTGAIVLDYIK